MATRLGVYNGALRLCGERKLANLTENREARHLLDDVWADGGVHRCLEQAQWKFAMRTVQLDYDPDFTREFGYERAFAKPDDWVMTASIAQDEYFRNPLVSFEDEAGYWFCDLQTIYVRYVSNDDAYGNDLSRWPAAFNEYVEAYFASKIVAKLTTDKERVAALLNPRSGILAVALAEAKNTDAINGPPRRPVSSSWATARRGGERGDRGRNGQLIG